MLRPPEKISVSEWADNNRVLTKDYSDLAGPWRTNRTPYLREPMDMFKARGVTKITLVFATQLGKTECEYNMVGYAVDQDQGSMLFVLPTDGLAKISARGASGPSFEAAALSEMLLTVNVPRYSVYISRAWK